MKPGCVSGVRVLSKTEGFPSTHYAATSNISLVIDLMRCSVLTHIFKYDPKTIFILQKLKSAVLMFPLQTNFSFSITKRL